MTDEITQQAAPTFRDELRSLINRHSKENGSNTPDWILATYLHDCLEAFDCAVTARDRWHRPPEPVPAEPTATKAE